MCNQTNDDEITEFWNEKKRQVKGAVPIQAIDLPPMKLKVFPNDLFFMSAKTSSRSVSACWADEDGIAAYSEAVLIGPKRAGRVLDPMSFVIELDGISQAHYDFADLLVHTHTHQNPFESCSNGVRWFCDLRVLEVHPSRRGKGLGVRLGAQFIHELRQKFDIGFFLLNPFPLQYSFEEEPRVVFNAEDNSEMFKKNVHKLKKLFAHAWGASPLPGSETHLYVRGSTPHILIPSTDKSHWSLSPLEVKSSSYH